MTRFRILVALFALTACGVGLSAPPPVAVQRSAACSPESKYGPGCGPGSCSPYHSTVSCNGQSYVGTCCEQVGASCQWTHPACSGGGGGTGGGVECIGSHCP